MRNICVKMNILHYYIFGIHSNFSYEDIILGNTKIIKNSINNSYMKFNNYDLYYKKHLCHTLQIG